MDEQIHNTNFALYILSLHTHYISRVIITMSLEQLSLSQSGEFNQGIMLMI